MSQHNVITFKIYYFIRLAFETSNILIGAVLLGGIAHLMIFMNGYWNDVLWMSVVLNVFIPIVIQRYLKNCEQKKQIRRSSKKYIEI